METSKVSISYYFFFFALLNCIFAAVLHDGVDVNAKVPVPIPIPGTDLDNEIFAVNTDQSRNETGRRSVIVTQNVTVKTPFLSVQYTNKTEIPKGVLAKDSPILGQALPLLPKGSDLDEVIEHLDIPVRVAELANLATAESPAQFREKFYSSSLLEDILSDIEDKSKYYHEVTNLLNQPNTLASQPTKKRITKREAIFSLEQNIDGPTVMVIHQPDVGPVEFSADDSVPNRSTTVNNEKGYSPEGRVFLPHLHLFTHRPVTASKRRPMLLPRPPIIHPVVRTLIPAASLLPFVRAFANPSVIQSLLQAIPRIPPIIAPRGDQIIHPPITSYFPSPYNPTSMEDEAKPVIRYEKPPEDSDFDVPIKDEQKPLPPIVDSFSTLLQDFSITR